MSSGNQWCELCNDRHGVAYDCQHGKRAMTDQPRQLHEGEAARQHIESLEQGEKCPTCGGAGRTVVDTGCGISLHPDCPDCGGSGLAPDHIVDPNKKVACTCGIGSQNPGHDADCPSDSAPAQPDHIPDVGQKVDPVSDEELQEWATCESDGLTDLPPAMKHRAVVAREVQRLRAEHDTLSHEMTTASAVSGKTIGDLRAEVERLKEEVTSYQGYVREHKEHIAQQADQLAAAVAMRNAACSMKKIEVGADRDAARAFLAELEEWHDGRLKSAVAAFDATRKGNDGQG